MKKMLMLAVLVLLVGCATPSKITEEYTLVGEKSVLTKKITEYDNSTFVSGKAVGLKIGYDPETYSPIVKFIYGRYESARVNRYMWYDSRYGLNDINLFTGSGSAVHNISVGPSEIYGIAIPENNKGVPPNDLPKMNYIPNEIPK